MVGAWLESGNDFYLEAIGEPYRLLEADEEDEEEDDPFDYRNSSHAERQLGRKMGDKALDAISGSSLQFKDKDGKNQSINFNDANWLVKIKRFLTDKPRTFLAKCVSRLRETYRKFLIKADKEKESGKIKWYKNIARKILQAIDWILRKIEKFATINYDKRLQKSSDHIMSKAVDNADKMSGEGFKLKGKITKLLPKDQASKTYNADELKDLMKP